MTALGHEHYSSVSVFTFHSAALLLYEIQPVGGSGPGTATLCPRMCAEVQWLLQGRMTCSPNHSAALLDLRNCFQKGEREGKKKNHKNNKNKQTKQTKHPRSYLRIKFGKPTEFLYVLNYLTPYLYRSSATLQ